MKLSLTKTLVSLLLSLAVVSGCKENPTPAEACVTGPNGGNPVIILGGTFEANESLLASAIEAEGSTYCVLELKGQKSLGEIPGTIYISISALALTAFVDEVLIWSGATQVDLVAHSQGVLASRFYLTRFGGLAKVGKLISLAGPNTGIDPVASFEFFDGPVLAPFGVTCEDVEPCIEMQRNSTFITNLNAGGMTPGDVEYFAFYTNHDEVVQYWGENLSGFPVVKYDNAELGSGATNIELGEVCPSRIVGHVGMVTDAVVIEMTLDALAGDPISVPSLMCLLPPTGYGEFSAELGSPVSIPDDGSAEASHSMVIAATGPILDLNVSVTLSHGWVGDLVVTLTHEETGTSVVLMDRPGVPASNWGCSGSDIDAVLDDQATDAVEDACGISSPAIGGALRSDEVLSAFEGEDITGTWTLTMTDLSSGVSGALEGWGLFWNDPPRVPSIDVVAYRPQTESLQRRAVEEAVEVSIGAGIRINSDDDNNDDLIEVELRFDSEPAPAGTEYVLKRSNSNLRVWASSSKGSTILDALDEAAIEAVAPVQSVWVESPEGGEVDLTFELRDTQTLQVLASDEVHFYSFTSLVIGLHGEFQFPTDPVIGPNEGISELAVALHKDGYDSRMYVENAVASDGSGVVYDEIVDAVQNRGVTSLGLYGFSHGGGSVYDLAERLYTNKASIGDFEIDFTGYIDSIENDSDVDLDAEIRRPIDTKYHVNYYQHWGFIPPWGYPVAGADVDVNVTSTSWGSFLWHITITNSADVQAGIYEPMVLRVQR